MFKIYLPALPSAADVRTPSKQHLFQGSGQRILFVDDEPILGKTAGMMLRRLGCQATIMTHPQETLDLFRKSPRDFDLVMTDLTMPGMTGLDLAGAVTSIRSDIPILLTSGFGGAWTEDKLQKLGIRQLVMKPMSLNVLSEALKSIFSQEIAAPRGVSLESSVNPATGS